jgi:hypothetical protein
MGPRTAAGESPLRMPIADGRCTSVADVRISRPRPWAGDGQDQGQPGLAIRRLGGGRFRLGGGRPIQGVIRLTSPHFHLPLTTSDVLHLLLVLVAPI